MNGFLIFVVVLFLWDELRPKRWEPLPDFYEDR
jgi:hypothetical protein